MNKIVPPSKFNFCLGEDDLMRAVIELSDGEFNEAWKWLGRLIRIRAKRIREELWGK